MPEELIKEISVLSMRPEDLLVVKTDEILGATRIIMLKNELVTLLRRYGYENNVLVLQGGLSVEVWKKEEQQ